MPFFQRWRAKVPSASERDLTVAFGVIIFLLLATAALMLMAARQVETKAHQITDNSLKSILMVGRMHSDLGHAHLLLHHLPPTPTEAQRSDLARQFDASRDDFASAATEYVSLAMYPGERQIWERLENRSADLWSKLGTIVELYQRDGDERTALQLLQENEAAFTRIQDDIAAIEEINKQEAVSAAQMISNIERQAFVGACLVALFAVAVTFWLGRHTAKVVGSRDRIMRQHLLDVESRNRDLDAFAGRVAHDLRGPMSTISVAAATLMAKVQGERGLTDVLRRAIERMDRIIEDLLSLARVDTAPINATSSPAALVAQLREEFAPQFSDAHGTLFTNVDEGQVQCSEGLLRQALINLVDNALKYRHPERTPEVRIEGKRLDDSYEIRVSDNGIGMSSAETARVFDPFYRGAHARDQEGTGLGLPIVKRILEANGGSIAVESLAGKGSVFILRLPVAGTSSNKGRGLIEPLGTDRQLSHGNRTSRE